MNRKVREKGEDEEQEDEMVEPVPPKFAANWAQIIRFDRIVMNVADCSYEVVTRVGKELKWKVRNDANNAQWDIWWTDWAVPPEVLMKMQHHQKINHFPGMYTLSRKNLLAKNLMRMRKKFPEEYGYFPLTWSLPGDYSQFKAYFETKPKGKARTYIVKPESLSQGKGIFLTRRLDDITPTQHCVVQRYLSKPYLIEGLKFDLRIYVLVAGVDPLRLYIYREGLARFATQNYVMPNKDNMEQTCMHLTNYAINKESGKFIFNENENDMGVGHKRSLEAVFKLMSEQGVDIVRLKEKINDIIVKTMISGLSHLRFQYRSAQPENYRGDMCFQLLGFDIIINDEIDPILLEINYTPSFSTDTPLDIYIKRNLIKDALTLMMITKQFKEATVRERKEFRDLRMMTGRKVKLTTQEKGEKRKKQQDLRDEYIDNNLGGFTKIFPLTADHVRTAMYDQFIRFQSQASGVNIEVKKDKQVSVGPIFSIARRNTQKLTKLPLIPVVKEQRSTTKLLSKRHNGQSDSVKLDQNSKTITTANELPLQDALKGDCPAECENQLRKCLLAESVNHSRHAGDDNRMLDGGMSLPHEHSQKVIKKSKAKEFTIQTRKKGLQRETLVPKTIQFQGNRFDGLCDVYRNEATHCNQ